MSETRQRTARILIRALPEEEAAIRERARAAGVSVPELLRRSALSRRVDPAAKSTSEFLRQLARIGSNLNQLTRLSHLGESNLRLFSEAIREVTDAARRVGREGAE